MAGGTRVYIQVAYPCSVCLWPAGLSLVDAQSGMALSRMHVKAQSPCYTELRAEATPVAIWRGIVDLSRRQAARDCGSLRV